MPLARCSLTWHRTCQVPGVVAFMYRVAILPGMTADAAISSIAPDVDGEWKLTD